MNNIFDCKKITEQMLDGIATTIKKFEKETGRTPQLVTIPTNANQAAISYLAQQQRTALKVGIHLDVPQLYPDSTVDQLVTETRIYQQREDVDGLVWLLPMQPDAYKRVSNAMRPFKDVDCQGRESRIILDTIPTNKHIPLGLHIPPTTRACMRLINQHDIKIGPGTTIALFGKGYIGAPLGSILTQQGCTVEQYDSKRKPTAPLKADIIISASDKPCIDPWMINGNIVIDLAHIPTENGPTGSLRDYEICAERASMITPEPGTRKHGSVGAITTAALLENVTNSYKRTVYVKRHADAITTRRLLPTHS